jgi:hypothetical protein
VLPFGSLAQVNLTDTCIGIFITGIFHLYLGECQCCSCLVLWLAICAVPDDGERACAFAVVIRSSLAPLDCTNRNGVWTMDAEPRVVCNNEGVHGRMKLMSVASLVLYGLGVPLSFLYFLHRYRREIVADQQLRRRCEGEMVLTNPNLHIRRWVKWRQL